MSVNWLSDAVFQTIMR